MLRFASPIEPLASSPGLTSIDRRFLDRAIELAEHGWGSVHPNPMVGCVLVRNGEVVGEGYHEEYGQAHAEVNALRRASGPTEGATAYVSLEPCAHHGKTPPCTTTLIDAGIHRVVFAFEDPGENSAGGAARLREGGLEVIGPVEPRSTARACNRAFYHLNEHSSPFVSIKLAVSADDKTTAGKGLRTQITGESAAQEVHRIRCGFDGIMIGSGTARVDDPLLTVRLGHAPRVPPVRIVLDSRAALSADAALFRDILEIPVIIFAGPQAPSERVERLTQAGAEVISVGSSEAGLDLGEVLERCTIRGIHSILCEGGGKLASGLIRAGLAQRLYLFRSLRELGTDGVPAFSHEARQELDKWECRLPDRRFGVDELRVFDRDLEGDDLEGSGLERP